MYSAVAVWCAARVRAGAAVKALIVCAATIVFSAATAGGKVGCGVNVWLGVKVAVAVAVGVSVGASVTWIASAVGVASGSTGGAARSISKSAITALNTRIVSAPKPIRTDGRRRSGALGTGTLTLVAVPCSGVIGRLAAAISTPFGVLPLSASRKALANSEAL